MPCAHNHRNLEGIQQALGNGDSALSIAVFQQDRKLIPSKAAQYVHFAQRGLNRMRRGHNQFITHHVTVHVIDVFEAVEIDKQHGELTSEVVRCAKGL